MSWLKLDNSKIDTVRWNRCVLNSKNEHVYGYTWYLKEVAESWVGFVLEDYNAVFGVPVKQKLGFFYIFQPDFYQRSEVFGDYSTADLFDLSAAVLKHFSKINITTAQNLFERSQVLNNLIIPDYLENNISTNTKRNINKAKKADCLVLESGIEDCNEAIDLFVSNTSYKLASNFKSQFLSLTNSLNHNSSLVIRKIIKQNENIAFAVCAKSERRLTLLLLANSSESKKYGAAHLLIQSLLEYSKLLHLIFDFEGSNNPGIARFYKSFGALHEPYFYFDQKLVLGLKNQLLKKV